MAITQYLGKKCVTFTIDTKENLPIIFPAILID